MIKEYHFKIIDSTSSYLKLNYDKYDNFAFVSSDFQTNGHGRYNRKWISKNGENLLFSILIKDKELISKYDSLSLASAVCVFNVLSNIGVKNISIKWPNDVLVNDKKIAGLLLESVSFGGNIEALIVGVGINVNSTDLQEIRDTSTSVRLELNKEILIEDFKRTVYCKFIELFNNLINKDSSYLAVVRENNYLKDKRVYANVKGKKTLVEVIDVNDDNSLKVKTESEYLNLYSGEVSFHL